MWRMLRAVGLALLWLVALPIVLVGLLTEVLPFVPDLLPGRWGNVWTVLFLLYAGVEIVGGRRDRGDDDQPA